MNFFSKKEPWQIAAARYFVENAEKGFTQNDFKEYMRSKYHVAEHHLTQFFREEIELPSGRDYSTAVREGSKGWIPPFELVSKIIDFDELLEARKNSRRAFIFSLLAVIIAALTLWIEWKT